VTLSLWVKRVIRIKKGANGVAGHPFILLASFTPKGYPFTKGRDARGARPRRGDGRSLHMKKREITTRGESFYKKKNFLNSKEYEYFFTEFKNSRN
jgi:hypothetical protein